MSKWFCIYWHHFVTYIRGELLGFWKCFESIESLRRYRNIRISYFYVFIFLFVVFFFFFFFLNKYSADHKSLVSFIKVGKVPFPFTCFSLQCKTSMHWKKKKKNHCRADRPGFFFRGWCKITVKCLFVCFFPHHGHHVVCRVNCCVSNILRCAQVCLQNCGDVCITGPCPRSFPAPPLPTLHCCPFPSSGTCSSCKPNPGDGRVPAIF